MKKISLKLTKNFPQTKHVCISNYIPAKIFKNFANCYCEKLKNIFNKWLQENKFPGLMKKTEITPVFIKLDNSSKDNYRPIITLPNLQRPSEVPFLYKKIILWKTSSENILQVSEKVTIRSIPF